MTHHWKYSLRLLIALLAAAVFVTSCGSADDAVSSATDTASDLVESASTDSSSSRPAATAVPKVFATSDGDAMDDDAMAEEEAMEEEETSGDFARNAGSSALVDPRSAGAAGTDAPSASAFSEVEESRVDDRFDDQTNDRFDGDAEGLFAPESPEPAEEAPRPDPARLQDNRFANYGYRQFIPTDVDPLSTFALDVDTGSWTVARRWLREGVLPPRESVRVEEYVNAFDYNYDTPRRGLAISVDGGPSPFDSRNVLVRVGVQAEQIAESERPPVALTFIVDTSGSMNRDDRLGLVKDSLEMLVDELNDDDTVAIVVYSNGSGVVLEPTAVRNSREIYRAIDSLNPGGSTNLESGLREGYRLADNAFRDDGINRVIIASDGVANAGITDEGELGDYIRRYADRDIQLVTLGYGMGNFNDTMMEQLADNGDGFYAYIDSQDEAERLFKDELTSTLVTAAIDAKIQVEFDADIVDEYRLIGFENRGVRDRDFRNDAVDAGELGAGHQVTAMYEIELRRGVDIADRGDIGQVNLRWEDPDTGEVIEIDEDIDLRDVARTFGETATDFRVATVVTAFAEVLRDNPYADRVDLGNIAVEASRVAERADSDEVDELVDMLYAAEGLAW